MAELDPTFIAEKEQQLACQPPSVSPFWHQKYVNESNMSWDKFYNRNSTHFFKDRHWPPREFPDLMAPATRICLEAGCGVGNMVFPTLDQNPAIERYFACDVSKNAIELVKNNPGYKSMRCTAFVADIKEANALDEYILAESVDVVTCIFVLSALTQRQHPRALFNLARCMKVGGVLLLRDYGRYDLAQVRFAPTSRLDENLYVRQDGTLAYYFTKEEIEVLGRDAGLEGLVEWKTDVKVNRRTGVRMDRVWIQARLVKTKHVDTWPDDEINPSLCHVISNE